MSDQDKTVYAGGGAQDLAGAPQTSTQTSAAKKNPLLIIGGIGCLLLLCAVLLISGGLYASGWFENTVAGLGGDDETPVVETPPDEPTSTPTPEPEPTEEQPTSEPEPTEEQPTAEPVTSEPVIGAITFALGATDTYEPVDPGTSFEEGITEIHAIFDYSGMLPDYTWERVWYLNGQEVLRNSAAWTDQENGRFDYFIDAGGAPLSPGEWVLELYVDGELRADGTFTIEGAEPEVAQVTDTPTPEPEPEATDTPAPKPSGGGVYKLLYSKWDGGQHNMHVADTNGNNEKLLFNRAAGPSWSPDGQQIFFFGEEGVDRQRLPDGREFVFDGVSNGIIALTNAAALPAIEDARLFQGVDWKYGSARWANVSPDGQMVAFDAKPGGDYRIYFLGTADNQQFRFEIVGEQGDWSPDSQKIVYRSGRDGITGIWISNRDDTGHTNITQSGSDSFPAWSPDGKTIAFSREESGNVDIYTMNVDGSNVQRLTDAPEPDTLPVYTPSGDIIFRSARSGSWSIWKMSSAGAGQTEIIPNAGVGPDWSFSRMDVR
jgi:hypothetical protein